MFYRSVLVHLNRSQPKSPNKKMNFKLRKEDLKRIDIPQRHMACLVTRSILEDGDQLGSMQRYEPFRDEDSGWRFFGVSDDPATFKQEGNLAFVCVEVAANYCPEIIPLIDMPVGTILGRDGPDEPLELFSQDN